MQVVVITYLPSPYQVELFNAIALNGGHSLTVIYLRSVGRTPIARNWAQISFQHDSISLDGHLRSCREARDRVHRADFVIFNYYQNSIVRTWMDTCAKRRIPWCFWGERTGYFQLPALGRLYRCVALARLHRQKSPIWGIGQRAVEQYEAEFGPGRHYFNVPYFSNLARFDAAGRERHVESARRRFLFCGSLISRKGADLLARSFADLARANTNVSLTIVGTGPLEGRIRGHLVHFAARVRFTGFSEWNELPRHYAEADILVAPSRHDGWALVVPEALASGLPVIGTMTMGAACEFIRHEENGWLIEAGNVAELTASMHEASILTPEGLRRRSDAARAAVASHQLRDGVRCFARAVSASLETFHR